MLVAVHGDVNKPGASSYIPGLPSTASDRSIWAGSQTPDDTVSFSRHSRSQGGDGIVLGASDDGRRDRTDGDAGHGHRLKPGSLFEERFEDAEFIRAKAPPPCRTTAVWTLPFWTAMAHLGFQ